MSTRGGGASTRERKVRTGVAFDDEIIDALDRHSAALGELGVSRSEVVNAILGEFLDGKDASEEVWEIISRRRVKKRENRGPHSARKGGGGAGRSGDSGVG